jgi:hypothetical protein
MLTDLDGLAGGPVETDGGRESGADVVVVPADAGDGGAVDDAGDAADAGAYAREVLVDQPVVYYRLDDPGGATVAQETMGTGLVGHLSAAASTGAPGLLGTWPGTAAALTPDQAGVTTIRVDRDLRLEQAAAVSVEAWFRTSSTPAEQYSLVSYGVDTAKEEPYVLYISAGYAAFYLGQPGGGSSKQAIAAFSPAAGTAHHLLGTYDGTIIKMYIDGALAATGVATGAITGYDGVNGLALGSAYDGKYASTGIIDEVAVYDKALSQARVSAHYLAGR